MGKYWATHIDPASISGQNSGAHFGYLAHLAKKHGQGGFGVGNQLTIAGDARPLPYHYTLWTMRITAHAFDDA